TAAVTVVVVVAEAGTVIADRVVHAAKTSLQSEAKYKRARFPSPLFLCESLCRPRQMTLAMLFLR
ncbi:MAG: hypothetical protein KDB07_08825, partial [Planctomycetes bacterium]|nr:hypothetical protein [Planctomycetota bacterium]